MGTESWALLFTVLLPSAATLLSTALIYLLPTPWLPRKTWLLLIYMLPVALWTGVLAVALFWGQVGILIPALMGIVAIICYRVVYIVDRELGSVNTLPYLQACVAVSYAICAPTISMALPSG